MAAFDVPLFIRGELIEDDWVEFGGRQSGSDFRAPDVHRYVDQLPLSNPAALQDMQEVSFDEILDVLEELGRNLDFDKKSLKAKVLGIIEREWIALKLNELFVIEFYSRKI